MAAPTTEKLSIYIGGRNITNYVDSKAGLRIDEERGRRISSASMLLKDGGDLGIDGWDVVLVMSPDFGANYMWGYITDHKEIKRGVVLDYNLTISRAEVRFHRAIINGTYTGTDATILSSILANAVPDLSDLFDFTSGVTAITTDSLTLDFNNETGLDAIERLADEVGANWGWTMDQNSRINMAYNPALNLTMDYFGSDISANSSWATDFAAWNSGNTVWDAAAGESGGGIEMTAQYFADELLYASFFRVGRVDDNGDHTMNFIRDDTGEGNWLQVTCSMKDPNAAWSVKFEILTYTEEGAFYASDDNTSTGGGGGGWVRHNTAWDLSNSSLFPETGFFEIQVRVATSNAAYIGGFMDQMSIEVVNGVPGTPIVYFDGDSADAQWMGDTNASPSLLLGSKHQLDWNKDAGDAPYDIEIGTTDHVGAVEIDYAGLESVNHMIVVGGFEMVYAQWIFRANNIQTIFDLPELLLPADGDSVIVVEENTGTDGTPIWTNRTVQEAAGNVVGDGNDLLWSQEKYDLLWNTAPPALERAFRVTGRTKQRIRATVTDSVDIDNTVERADVLYDETITTLNEAHAAGYAALQERKTPKQVVYTTYEPGLKVNQAQQIADSARGFDEELIIQRIERTYIGGGFAKFRVTVGQLQADLTDIASTTRKLAEDKPPIDATTSGVTLDTILDGDQEAILDGNNQPIFQVT
jgi:hypothetical protein